MTARNPLGFAYHVAVRHAYWEIGFIYVVRVAVLRTQVATVKVLLAF
jgi:hypothetical protein